jgi:hypothetical protein
VSSGKPRKKDKTGYPKKKRQKHPKTGRSGPRRGLRGKEASQQLAAIAADLLPDAAGHARRGRPRLLAVCARILLAKERIDARYEESHIAGHNEMLTAMLAAAPRRRTPKPTVHERETKTIEEPEARARETE